MKNVHLCAAMALALVALTAGPALAQEAANNNGSIINVPWGAWASELIILAGSGAVWVLGRAIGVLPGPVQLGIRLTTLDQVGKRVIETAAFDLSEKIKKEGYTADVRSEILAKAINAFIVQAPATARKFKDTLELKLKARVEEYIRKAAKA